MLALLRRSPKISEPPKGLEKIKLIRDKRARNIALRVDAARGVICLVIPQRASEKSAWRFADENRAWIKDHAAGLEKPVPFTHGAVLPVFGVERTLRIFKTDDRLTRITLHEKTIDVYTSRPDPSANIKKFFYELLLGVIEPMAREKSVGAKRSYSTIILRDTRARWGSCAPHGRLMFCWKLVFAPMDVIDYVVGHECAHLTHMNHSAKFWDLCDKLSKRMAYSRDWLIVYGDKLMMYGLPE